eukprot:SAG11_NODE_306_length_10992_cov_46.270816_5_plen_89_part_00
MDADGQPYRPADSSTGKMYDLDIIEGWSGDYGEITYINIDGNSGAPRHDDGPDGGGAASTIEDARCGAFPQPSVGACTVSWWAGATNN